MTRFQVGADDKAHSVRYFQSSSQTYHRQAERGSLRHLRARERQAVFDLARFDQCSGRMIDVGCGMGVYALAAKAVGLSVTAIDVSPWAIDNVRGKVDVALVGDVECLDVAGEYEIVVCAGVLDYVSDPALGVRNLCRLVSAAGRLIILVPRVGIGGSLHALIAKFSSGLRVNLFDHVWLAREARRWGLELIRTRRPLPHNLVALFQRPAINPANVAVS
jgi:2-polyprenyl-3-methyl-5-hydroxy-6-metoxy-1,4-benzoquinol methylase